jgi:hypothetical protein
VAYQVDAATKVQEWLARRWAMFSIRGPAPELSHRPGEFGLWMAVGVLAAYSHLLMDIVCSANKRTCPPGECRYSGPLPAPHGPIPFCRGETRARRSSLQ